MNNQYPQMFRWIVFIGLLLFRIQPLVGQIDLIGTGNSHDLISMPVVSGFNDLSFWFSPSVTIADYSYESVDNELYLAAVVGFDWKNHLRLTAILPVHRCHPDGLDALFNDLEWNPGRSRLSATVRLKEYRGIVLGTSAGIWQLPVSRYWDDPLENHWCGTAGLHLEKSADFGLLALSMEFVRFSDRYKLENDRRLLWHMGLGYRLDLSDKFNFIGELCYDQANPKYLTDVSAEIQNWYLMNLGLSYWLGTKLSIRVGFSMGFRDKLVLFPKEKSRFDLAKESLRLFWEL